MRQAGQCCKKTDFNKEILSSSIIIFAWLGLRIYVHQNNWATTTFPIAFLDDDGGQWYYPMTYAKNNFLKSLLYLRGEGPLPQFLMTLLAKVFDWPFRGPIDSFVLAIMTLLQALMMRQIVRSLGFGLLLSSAIAVLWVVSTDCLAVEIEAWTRGFYEAVTGFMFLLSLWVYARAIRTGSHLFSWLFGATCAALIMSRATLSLFFVVPLLASLFLKTDKRILIGIIPLLVQLAWGSKNYYAFGQFQFELSSLSGSIMQTPLEHSGYRPEFIKYAFENSKYEDTCILRYIENSTQVEPSCSDILNNLIKRDAELQEKIDDTGVVVAGRNSYADYRITQEVKPVYVRYMLSHPWVVWVLFKQTFPIFWKITEYGLLGWWGNGPDAPSCFSVIRQVLVGVAGVNQLTLNSLSLLAFAWSMWLTLRRRIASREWQISQVQAIFMYAFLAFFYIQFFACVVGGLESNRYRFAVEPIIWILPFLTWRYIKEIRQKTNADHGVD